MGGNVNKEIEIPKKNNLLYYKVIHFENNVDHKEKLLRDHDQNFQQIWDNIKWPSLRIIGVSEGSETEAKWMHNLFNNTISKNFLILKNVMEIQTQEGCRSPNIQNNRSTSRDI